VKEDPNGYSLHHLYVVARRVFRGQQAEPRARRGGDAFDVTFVSAAIRIAFNLDRLADLHRLQLTLFEIRRDPDVIQRNDGNQRLTYADCLAGFHVALTHE